MIAAPVVLVVVLILKVFGLSFYQSLCINKEAAKRSGLPFVVVYFGVLDPWWIVLQAFLLPIFERLPRSWTDNWLPLVIMDRMWHTGHSPFARIGADTFIAVSWSKNTLWTCDPEVISQITARRADFPKPVENLQLLNVYGPTVTAAEGKEGRLYRKTAAFAFGEKTHRLAWRTSVDEARRAIASFNDNERNGPLTTRQFQTNIANFALSMLSTCLYGRRIEADDGSNAKQLQNSHKMTYSQSLIALANRPFTELLVPRAVLKYSPLQSQKNGYEAYREFGQYLREMKAEKEAQVKDKQVEGEPNLITAFVQASLGTKDGDQVSPEAVLGNMFAFVMAGHETSANTSVFLFYVMACFPEAQKSVQADLDRLLGDRDPSEWTYEKDFPALQRGWLGAVINEVLRLYGAIPIIPQTTRDTPRTITAGAKQFTVPANTYCFTHINATHRNPKYWPLEPAQARASPGEGNPYPLASFNPEMWLQATATGGRQEKGGAHEDGQTAQPLMPVPGSFVPFSEGSRGCIGARFARVEIVGLAARLLKDYSVELDVGSSGEAGDKRTAAWQRAREQAARSLSTSVALSFTFKMSEGVPIRFVPRRRVSRA